MAVLIIAVLGVWVLLSASILLSVCVLSSRFNRAEELFEEQAQQRDALGTDWTAPTAQEHPGSYLYTQ